MAAADDQQCDPRQYGQIGDAVVNGRLRTAGERNQMAANLGRRRPICQLGCGPAILVEKVAAANGYRAVRPFADDDCLGAALTALNQCAEPAKVICCLGPACSKRFGHDGHAPATDQAVVPAVIVVQGEGEQFRLVAAIAQHAQSALLHFRLYAAAAQRSCLAAVREHQHGGPGLLRRRAARLHEGAEDTIAPCVQSCRYFREKFTHEHLSDEVKRLILGWVPKIQGASYRTRGAMQAAGSVAVSWGRLPTCLEPASNRGGRLATCPTNGAN